MVIGRRALIAAALLVLVAGSAAAASVTLSGSACAGYALERRGNDLVVTCAGPWSFYTAPKRTVFATVRDWYLMCAYHMAMPTQAGVTIICSSPIRRR